MERLPRDLMVDIISRLPMKYVLRCKSVSKSWEALLISPSFAATHFNRVSTLHPFSDYITKEEDKLFNFTVIEEEDSETSTISKLKLLDFPFFEEFTGRPFLMSSCLGYLCLSEINVTLMYYNRPSYRTNPMYLFNPITGANILLPHFQSTVYGTCLYGFGLDVSTQECKVVLVYLYPKAFSVQVHTVGRDCSWRTNTVPNMLTHVAEVELKDDDLQTSLPLGFNGSIHWIVLGSVDKKDRLGPQRACILSFQLDTEVFRIIPMPAPLQVIKPYFSNSMFYALQVCGGCLSIIYSPKASFVDTWVMADYNISDSWVKTLSIQLNCMREYRIQPIGFCKKGELMLHLDKEGLVSYNIDTDTYKILSSCRRRPFPFVGSLISLKSAYGDSETTIVERLTRDLTIDIISRLPMKSVLRCICVCKSWNALLISPSFAATHFNRVSTLHPFSDYITKDEDKLFNFTVIEEEDSETSTISKLKLLDFSFFEEFTRRPFLMSSCLGYLCLSARSMYCGRPSFQTNPVYLFNPITEANILLPPFKDTPYTTCLYGFGLDVATQECKVLLVHLHEKTFTVQVHTVGRDCSWRTNTVPSVLTDVTEAELMNDYLQTSLPLGFNGSIHWIVLSSVDKKDRFGPQRACILSFQLDTEVFRIIPMPAQLQVIKPYFCNSMFYALQVCGGCLSIIYSPQASFVDTWVMADYNISDSWVKTLSIQLNCMREYRIKPIGFRKKGELMLHLDDQGLVSYNIDTDRYKILSSCTRRPFPFVGSLISLKSAYGDSENGVFHVQEPSSD